jgi:hypothetical protein
MLPACGESDPGPSAPVPGPAAADGKADSASGTVPGYAEMQSYLESTSGDVDGWFGLTGNLRKEFDDVCGDTFCGGDFPPWAVNLSCSVSLGTGKISRCSWLFAGAYGSIDPHYGTVKQNKKFWTCALPWSGYTPADLIKALGNPTGADTALRRPLTGGKSTYDALGSCGLGQ